MVSSLLSSCPVDLQLNMSSLHARNWSIHVYIVTQLKGASASLLVIEESADLYVSTAMGLIEHVLLEITSLTHRLQ